MPTAKPVTYMDEVPAPLKPYVKAMLKASGLNEFDAISSVVCGDNPPGA
jgi:hypothetical protein